MEANELRIGNLVYVNWLDSGKKVQTNYGVFDLPKSAMSGWEDDTGLRMNTCEKGYAVHLNIVEPIPLTKEWLTRFRFNHWINYANNYYSIGWFTVIQASDDKYRLHGFTCEIRYVHQLQNLYFALTGEELVIK